MAAGGRYKRVRCYIDIYYATSQNSIESPKHGLSHGMPFHQVQFVSHKSRWPIMKTLVLIDLFKIVRRCLFAIKVVSSGTHVE